MSRDASSEVYLMPFRSNDHNVLCGKSNLLSIPEGEIPQELLEIRITDMSQEFDDPTFPSRLISAGAASDIMSVIKQEMDVETLNQLLIKEVKCLPSLRPAEQAETKGEEVKNSTTSAVTYHNSPAALDSDLQNHDQEFDSLKLNYEMNLELEGEENLVLYSNDNGLLNSVQVLDVDHSDDNVWISDPGLLSLSSATMDTNSNNVQQIDLSSSQLVPVKVEDGVVYINAAPSVSDSLKSYVSDEVLLKHDVPLSAAAAPNRPSVISLAGKNGRRSQDCDDSEMNSIFSQDMDLSLAPHSFKKSGFHSLLKPKIVSSKNSRSVLKPSLTGRLKSHQLKYQSGVLSNKEETVKSNVKLSKSTGKKPQSLAVVAISSDKTKDLTEIVVSTSKGEQIFKGKTSELINATPDLWCLSNPKSDLLSSPKSDLATDSYDFNGFDDDDEPYDEQPVTDALRRLGIPALKWVQTKPDDERMWFCPEKDCKRLFSRLHLLKVHILGHYGVRPYKCDFPNCQWAFYTHFKLKRHKETHLHRKDFKCSFPECGRSFSTIYNLNTHQKLHKRPAEIICSVKNCNELFQTRRSLEHHLRQHGTDHAPYTCPYSSCQKRYYSVNSVNSHIRSHQHKDDEIKCQWAGCTKVFNKPCRLKAHMRTHTGDKPYPCNHPGCNWAFSSSSKLKRHQHKHTNVRNFECPMEGCGKLFMRSEHLKEHILTHSTERTFKCPHPNCNVRFSAKSSLYVHSKKHKAKIHCVPPAQSPSDVEKTVVFHVGKPTVIISGENESNGQSNVADQSTSPIDVLVCPIEHCGQTFLQLLDLREHVTQAHSPTEPIEISASTQTLDLIPLLSEDEALVAELASMDPVPFTNDSVTNLNDSSLVTADLDNSSNVLSNLPGYMDDTGASSNLEQVVASSLDTEDKCVPNSQEPNEDIELVLNPGSARSSITFSCWTEFKKQRQRQAIPLKHRQSRRQAHQTAKPKKQTSLINSIEEDQRALQTRTSGNEGLSTLRAPLDVVLGAGLLGSGLLLPDDLAASSDIYSGEDGILAMDSGFVPSTINLRDLE